MTGPGQTRLRLLADSQKSKKTLGALLDLTDQRDQRDRDRLVNGKAL
jgi:hypothetical protein